MLLAMAKMETCIGIVIFALMQVGELQHTVKYILKLLETTKSLLTLFDSFISSADVIPGGMWAGY